MEGYKLLIKQIRTPELELMAALIAAELNERTLVRVSPVFLNKLCDKKCIKIKIIAWVNADPIFEAYGKCTVKYKQNTEKDSGFVTIYVLYEEIQPFYDALYDKETIKSRLRDLLRESHSENTKC